LEGLYWEQVRIAEELKKQQEEERNPIKILYEITKEKGNQSKGKPNKLD
jgi:hypothetical protein